MHPSLTRPYLMTEPPLHTDIIHYENIPGFSAVRQNILRYEHMDEGDHSYKESPEWFQIVHGIYFISQI